MRALPPVRPPLPFSEHRKRRSGRDEGLRLRVLLNAPGVRQRAGKRGPAGMPARRRIAQERERKRSWLARVAAFCAARLGHEGEGER